MIEGLGPSNFGTAGQLIRPRGEADACVSYCIFRLSASTVNALRTLRMETPFRAYRNCSFAGSRFRLVEMPLIERPTYLEQACFQVDFLPRR
jgi:hypothetical protein